MFDKIQLNEISTKIYSNPSLLLEYNLSVDDLKNLNRRLYNISLTDPKGREFLLNLKQNATSFNEKNALDLATNSLEKASNLLWFGHTGEEGLYDITKTDKQKPPVEVNINDIIGKKTPSKGAINNKVSNVNDLIKQAYNKVNNNEQKSLDRKNDDKII